MNYIKEHIELPKEFPFKLLRIKSRQALIHCHECLEINLIVQGTGYYIIEEKHYPIQPGDIFIINNSERHMAVHEEAIEMIVMVFDLKFIWEQPFDYHFLGPFFDRSPQFSNRIRTESDSYKELCHSLEKIVIEYDSREIGWEMVVKATIMLFLSKLVRYYKKNDELGIDVKNHHRFHERIRPVMDYIHSHFDSPIELGILAERIRMSKTYLCTYFKDAMGITLFEYIEQVRVNHGCKLLKTTSLPITEIASLSGFNSTSYFNRVFKRILSISPRAYREESKYSSNSS
ncbi:AraC family transcriptional regulator [Paenibacillus sp. UNC451MF]|uniref:AraC family transcriptional regulator n=1 Tax=Paenibacillus sp. UNC451MF TaxID=1449063 RepID=UPI00048D2402|nr:AraC family transcriptional regulator [Paenibacillus sp. UNC451MF]